MTLFSVSNPNVTLRNLLENVGSSPKQVSRLVIKLSPINKINEVRNPVASLQRCQRKQQINITRNPRRFLTCLLEQSCLPKYTIFNIWWTISDIVCFPISAL